MQTTLLGLAIAFIIALLAALIGPYFVDWNQFRSQFEAEASRVVGAQVRVDGALDARLLPTPSLRLRSLVVGGANDLGRLRADQLDVEFSLGALMRGEWRASELTVNGMALDLGLDRHGRVDWPAAAANPSLGSLAIERLSLTGRIALHDAVSRSTLELSDIAFSGDVRALAGSVRGDGAFTWSGTRWPFRISSSRGEGDGVRLHLGLQSGEHGAAAEIDGMLAFAARAPRFDGAITLSGSKAPAASAPWQISARLKADASQARLEQLEASYGSDDAALKLAGDGDLRFGASPLLQASLSARRLDADKLLTKQASADEPAQWWARLCGLLAAIPPAPLPMEVSVKAEQVLLGGRPVQDVGALLRANRKSWSVERMDFQAPGATTISLRGEVDPTDPSVSFGGALNLDSSDPGGFAAWLSGQAASAERSRKPLRLSGQVDLAADHISVSDLKAEFDGGAVAGRVALFARGLSGDSEFDGALTADRLDFDAAAALMRAIGAPQSEWPDRARLSLDVARATAGGQDLHRLAAKIAYDPKTVTLAELKVGSSDGVFVDGAGAFKRDEMTGKLTLNAASASVDQLTKLLEPLAPAAAARIKASGGAGPAQLKAAVDLGRRGKDHAHAEARIAMEVRLPQVNGSVVLTAAPPTVAAPGVDAEALARSEFNADLKLSAARGQALLNLLGLDRVVAAGDAPAQLQAAVAGRWRAPLRVQTRLSGSDLDVEAKGVVTPSGEPAADLELTMRRGDLAPLLNLGPSTAVAKGASLSAHLTLAGHKLRLSGIDGAVAGMRIRGHVAMSLDHEYGVDGELGMDSLDLSRGFALVIGALGDGAAAGPLGRGLLQGWHGRIGFEALRGVLPGGGELRPVKGVIKSDGQLLSVADIKGGIGGGQASGDIDVRQSSSGLGLAARVQLAGVDGAALRYRGLAMPDGRVTLHMTLATQGRSAAALTGGLSGSGSLTLDSARIAGLNPKAIAVAIEASDRGQVGNEDQLRSVVAATLSSGSLAIGSVQIPFTIRDGRLSVGATTLDAADARAIVSGGYDITADQADIRASLTPTMTDQAIGSRPSIEIFAAGPPDALHRSVDVAALSSWLAMRAIDRETRRLDALERSVAPPAGPQPPAMAMTPPAGAAPAPGAAAPSSIPPVEAPLPDSDPRRNAPRSKRSPPTPPQASYAPPAADVAPLPPPIEIKPAPGARSPRSRPPLIIAPPAANPARPGF